VVELGLREVGHAAALSRLGGREDRLDVVGAHSSGDRVDDESRRDRRAVVVQDRLELRRVDLLLVDQHHAQLRVAVLLDDEHRLVLGDEAVDRGAEGEAAHPKRVDVHALLLERLERLGHRRAREPK
jgi:hypothetical protein